MGVNGLPETVSRHIIYQGFVSYHIRDLYHIISGICSAPITKRT